MAKLSEGIEVAQTGIIIVIVGLGAIALIWVSKYFKSAEDTTKAALSPEDRARYEAESSITKLGVVLDETVFGGVVRESGESYAQATYDRYYKEDPLKAQRYAEMAGIDRFGVSLGDTLTFGYASKAGTAFANLWR